MLSWLLGLWGRRRRSIFYFWDGRRIRRADPMVAARVLDTHPQFDWSQHPVLVAAAGDMDALAITAAAVREAFELPAFAKGGLTEQECLQLLADFTDYLEGLKKNTSPSLMSPQPSASPDVSATSNSSDSGSTATGPKPELPAGSGTASG